MKLRTGFLFFNYSLTAMGLVCLWFSAVFSPLTGIMILCGLGVCLVLEVKKVLPLNPPLKILSPSWGLLALPLFYLGFDLPLLDLLVWVLMFLLFSRLIFKTELNDYLFGYMLSLICLLLGAMVAQNLTFACIFIAFYMVLCWGLIHYNLMAESAGNHSPPDVFKLVEGKESIQGRLFGLSAGLMVGSLILTTIIFVGFPRLGMGLVPSGPPSMVSGFSESVRLGDVGRIKTNPSVVMRVEFIKNGKPHRPLAPVFWRGVVLDHFNGNSWFSTARTKWKFVNQPGVGTRLLPFDPAPGQVRQNIYMDEFDSNVIFTHGFPLFVDGNFRHLQLNRNLGLKILDQNARLKSVTLISDEPSSITSPHGEIWDLNSEVQRRKFLQLPAVSPAIIRLAKTLTDNVPSRQSRAQSILDHLRGNFDYSLDLEEEPGHNTLDHFLFERKKGHCEYFASSMVVLLRLAGIPSRMVNGFLGVEWNDLGQYMVVRQKHAHSWVEAYLPEKGWVVFDPTPADPAFSENGFDNSMQRGLDLLRLNWQRYIVRYSLSDQTRLFTKIKSTGEETLDSIQRLATLDQEKVKTLLVEGLTILSIAAPLAIALFFARGPINRWWFLHFSRQPFPVWLYGEMLLKLEAVGIHKQPHWTHKEFLQRLPNLPSDKRERIEKITTIYETSRFGQTPLTETTKKAFLNHLRKI